MISINFLTVCTDKYPIIYAEKITKQFLKSTKMDVSAYCLTDRPELVTSWATPLKLEVKSSGWWNKLNLYNPTNPCGWNLYLDLDIEEGAASMISVFLLKSRNTSKIL